jgi:predicted nucleic acid-binding protein
MMVLLDSTALIDAQRGRRAVEFEALLLAGHTLATTPINIAEVYAGMRTGEEERIKAVLAGIDCIESTLAIGRRAGLLLKEWRRRGRAPSLPDMMVAATAIEHGFALLTDNRKNFPMPELTFYPPA